MRTESHPLLYYFRAVLIPPAQLLQAGCGAFWRAIINGSALKTAVWKRQHLTPKVCFAPWLTIPEFLVSAQTACQLQGGPAHSTDLESSQGSMAARSSRISWLDLTKWTFLQWWRKNSSGQAYCQTKWKEDIILLCPREFNSWIHSPVVLWSHFSKGSLGANSQDCPLLHINPLAKSPAPQGKAKPTGTTHSVKKTKLSPLLPGYPLPFSL